MKSREDAAEVESNHITWNREERKSEFDKELYSWCHVECTCIRTSIMTVRDESSRCRRHRNRVTLSDCTSRKQRSWMQVEHNNLNICVSKRLWYWFCQLLMRVYSYLGYRGTVLYDSRSREEGFIIFHGLNWMKESCSRINHSTVKAPLWHLQWFMKLFFAHASFFPRRQSVQYLVTNTFFTHASFFPRRQSVQYLVTNIFFTHASFFPRRQSVQYLVNNSFLNIIIHLILILLKDCQRLHLILIEGIIVPPRPHNKLVESRKIMIFWYQLLHIINFLHISHFVEVFSRYGACPCRTKVWRH